jgi:F0F1-type ATP synthase membrane subunit c/vacuolar-type H+-ATPase subunit K
MHLKWMGMLLVGGGVFAGLIIWQKVVAWTIGKLGLRKDTAALAKDPKAATRIFLSLMAGWWMVVGLAILALVVTNDQQGPSGWLWFFIGMTLTPLLVGINYFSYLHRFNRRKARDAESAS